jgi:outer membrane lipoprotein-sorting protein
MIAWGNMSSTGNPINKRKKVDFMGRLWPRLACLLLLPIVLVLPTAGEEMLSADAILDRVNAVVTAPGDQTLYLRLVLLDADGKEEDQRGLVVWQKGKDYRMGKFLEPASQRGIGFLSLPNDLFYVYMPAYKKTQRIASRQKSGRFAGTDFSYQDLGVQYYTDEWSARILETEPQHYLLELTAVEGNSSGYARLCLRVDRRRFYPTEVEFYDEKGVLVKVLTSRQIEELDGYLVAREMEMVDRKRNHRTIMVLEKVEFDTGLEDSFFSERYLSRSE